MRKLFLDDERAPFDCTWNVVRSYDAFVAYIESTGVPDVISFDHDLAFEHYPTGGLIPSLDFPNEQLPYASYTEKTGYHAAKWLEETGRLALLNEAWVHSMNSIGRTNIMRVLVKARIPKLYFVGWRGKTPVLLPPTLIHC